MENKEVVTCLCGATYEWSIQADRLICTACGAVYDVALIDPKRFNKSANFLKERNGGSKK